MHLLGLDIGTTSISAVVLEPQTGALLDSVTLANDAWLDGARTLQNPARIEALALDVVARLCRKHAPVACIGLTGQMHGILYTNAKGRACSPLYTWQDTHGNLPSPQAGYSYAQALEKASGYHPLASGYGTVTHYALQALHAVPPQAAGLCTIADYMGMRLCGNTLACMHASNAASLGVYSPAEKDFDRPSLARAGMDAGLFPRVTDGYTLLGSTRDGIPVAAAIGDNQASFLGSVREADSSLLINVGTGGQISLLSDTAADSALLESRPYTDGNFLLVGSALCSGRAYALLERFFADVVELATGTRPGALYEAMERAARPLMEQQQTLYADTRFDGTRQDSAVRGTLYGIGLDNLTPGHLTRAVLEGMAQEFYDLYAQMALPPDKPLKTLVASGNGVRKNPLLQEVLQRTFGLPLHIPAHSEEAAFGAALFACVSAGIAPELAHAQACIRYHTPSGHTTA